MTSFWNSARGSILFNVDAHVFKSLFSLVSLWFSASNRRSEMRMQLYRYAPDTLPWAAVDINSWSWRLPTTIRRGSAAADLSGHGLMAKGEVIATGDLYPEMHNKTCLSIHEIISFLLAGRAGQARPTRFSMNTKRLRLTSLGALTLSRTLGHTFCINYQYNKSFLRCMYHRFLNQTLC